MQKKDKEAVAIIRVKVKYLLLLSTVIGKNEEDFCLADPVVISDLLEAIADKYGTAFKREFYQGRKEPFYLVLINGRYIDNLNGLNSKLADRDQIVFIPPISGG